MNDTKFIRQLNRNLYYYHNKASSILKSRTFTLARNIRVAVSQPVVFVRKGAHLVVRNPRKLVQILVGRRTIQNVSEDQEKMAAEYASWIKNVERQNLDLKAQRQDAQKLAKKPLVSLITPVWNPPVDAHNKLIQSVIDQTYSNFELLLFDFGTDPEVRDLLDDWAKRDKRIVVKHDLPNGGISKNSNFCLDFVQGEYLGLLDHDDVLAPNALFECIKAVNDHGAEFIYSDKDKITEDDRRHEPLFKPDWSPEMELGGNYLTHFDLMKTQLVRDLGGWDEETDGAQDWDLFLRILEVTDKIVHVPKILYHWRTVESSTATGVGVKPYALAAQRLAVNKHLKRQGLKGRAVQDETGQSFIKWPSVNVPRNYVIQVVYGDIGNVTKLINKIRSDYGDKSQIFVCVEKGFLEEAHLDKLEEALGQYELLEYVEGTFAGTITQNLKLDRATLCMSDSNKSINTTIDGTSWASQISGWLTIDGVGMAGAACYGEDGRVVDVGSFFDARTKLFEKYHFSARFRSGYNGYLQWTRNIILPSQRLCAFDSSLMKTKEWKMIKDQIRDDEFLSGLALVNHSKGNRAVYDPAVDTLDSAPFYCVVPPSDALNAFLTQSCAQLLTGDPYYNPNLDSHYQDPKPLTSSTHSLQAETKFRIRTADMTN